jgi:hypothetical protein
MVFDFFLAQYNTELQLTCLLFSVPVPITVQANFLWGVAF